MTDIEERDGDVADLARRIEGIRFAMVTLPAADGGLRGRPLTVQQLEFDGTLWFLVSKASDWTGGLAQGIDATGPGTAGAGTPANVAFSDPDGSRWVSISGTASLVDDRDRIHDMWNALYDAWFDGKDDPDATLLRFDADVADYWDADAGKIVRMARLVRAAITGEGSGVGDRGTLHP